MKDIQEKQKELKYDIQVGDKIDLILYTREEECYCGILKAFNDDKLIIDCNGKIWVFNRKEIERICIEKTIKKRRAEKREYAKLIQEEWDSLREKGYYESWEKIQNWEGEK